MKQAHTIAVILSHITPSPSQQRSDIKILNASWSFSKGEKQNPKMYKKQFAETALCVVSKVIFIQHRGVGSKGMGKLWESTSEHKAQGFFKAAWKSTFLTLLLWGLKITKPVEAFGWDGLHKPKCVLRQSRTCGISLPLGAIALYNPASDWHQTPTGKCILPAEMSQSLVDVISDPAAVRLQLRNSLWWYWTTQDPIVFLSRSWSTS